MVIVVTSGSLHGVMHTGHECQRYGFNSHSRQNIFNFHHTHNTGCFDHAPVETKHCMVVEPTLFIYVSEVTACVYVTICTIRLTIPGGWV